MPENTQQSSTQETSSRPFLPPPPKSPDADQGLEKAVAQSVINNLNRLDEMATAIEARIDPEELSSGELSRLVSTAARLRVQVIREGAKVVKDVLTPLRQKKQTLDA